jgi:flagellar basal-body rod protein FlgC
MSPVSAIALSGMNAATLRLTAAASNIANAHSTGPLPGAPNPTGHAPAYTPLHVEQTTAPGGGVLAHIALSTDEPIPLYDPDAPYADDEGMVATPDIDQVAEILELIKASQEFAANLLVLRIDAEMSAQLLDMKA